MTLAPQYLVNWADVQEARHPIIPEPVTTTREIGKGVWEAKRSMRTRHPSWVVAYGRTERKALKALAALGYLKTKEPQP